MINPSIERAIRRTKAKKSIKNFLNVSYSHLIDIIKIASGVVLGVSVLYIIQVAITLIFN